GAVAKRTGRKLLAFDRKLGARFVAGADEAGRGPLAGPLVVAGVLLDLECLRHNRARPLSLLNDSKQLDRATREELYRAVLACAEKSAAIAAASIVAKVTRDRYMHTLDATCPAYGFYSHVGYITPAHSAVVRAIGPSEIHRRSFEARCYAEQAAA